MDATTTQKVIIDCDPGIDDSLALMLALASPELEILGITTVAGNVPSDLGAKNALKILNHCHRLDIPVYCGASKPLKRTYVSAQDTHGADGLGESKLPEVSHPYHLGASDFINQALYNEPDLTIITLGPLTNIAQAHQKAPAAWKNCGRLVSMGGNFKSFGNCSPVAEYNYWCDPDAAAYCFDNLPLKIEMVGLDVTRKMLFTPNILELIRQTRPKEADFIQKITRFYFDFHWQYEKVIGCVINDPLAVAYTLWPELCQGFAAHTKIATTGFALGQSIVDEKNFWQAPANSFVLTQVNALAAMKLFLSRACGLDPDMLEQTLPQIADLEVPHA